jgi:hypothetical protein
VDKEQTEFFRILLEDVQWALDGAAKSDTAADRRNLLRTIVSAAEGVSWVYRMHILSMAKDLDVATPQMEMAFAEATFSISSSGEMVEQARYISLTAMIRFSTKVAQAFCPDLVVDFGHVGWQRLKVAIATRNRITHPKKNQDLDVSEGDVEAAKVGFFWFLEMSLHVMEQTVRELRISALMTRKVIDELIAGDPDTLALYERVHRERDE